jgi:hypothetical protein
MALNVYEAGSYDQPARVEAFARRGRVEQARRRYARDAVAFYGKVAVKPRAARAVDYAPARDDYVVVGLLRRGWEGRA